MMIKIINLFNDTVESIEDIFVQKNIEDVLTFIKSKSPASIVINRKLVKELSLQILCKESNDVKEVTFTTGVASLIDLLSKELNCNVKVIDIKDFSNSKIVPDDTVYIQ